MPIRKKGNIDIRTSAKGAQATQTGYTFYSYDKNSAALYFEFNDQNGQPTDLKKATVRLVMILNDDDKKNASVMTKAEIISELRGTAKYDIPESLLGYEGKVTGYVYLEFEDGSHTDEGRFIFNIKRSMISNVLPKAGDKYVQDFEDVKERVEQAGDSATKDIKKARDNAESQIGDYVGEVESAKDSTIEDIDKALPEVVESAKQDISSSVSDVQSTADKATSDIKSRVDAVENAKNSTVGDIEKSKDNAESQIGEYVGEVESAKDSTIEDIDKALPEVEDKLDEVAGKISELDISDTNLLKGTSDEWEEITIPEYRYGTKLKYHSLEELSLKPGDSVTVSEEIDNTIDNFDTGVYIYIGVPKEDRRSYIVEADSKQVKLGESKTVSTTITIPEKATEIVIRIKRNDKSANKVVKIKGKKLNRGARAAPWTPAPEDIVLKSELEKIKQAIINLGGSI